MKIYKHFSQIATLSPVHEKDGRYLKKDDLEIIEDGAIVFDQSKIHWVGPTSKIPDEYSDVISSNYSGKCLLPEIVDCHTHLLFGGNRAHEYSMRLNGEDYQAIANAGGGILHTQSATNALSKETIFQDCIEKIERIHSFGVGSIEIKSGYGLNFDRELLYSQIIDDLKKHFAPKIQIKNTYMAAHAIPSLYDNSSDYLDGVVLPLLEKLAPLNIIDAVDIFHEQNYFNKKDALTLFKKAKELNLDIKIHADEFADNKGAYIAAKAGALSADHLLRTTEDGINALAESQTVATLLPGTAFFLGKEQVNARKFLDAGVKVAIGSDYNPGSCHFDNVLFLASLAAPQYKMNITELLASITYNASHAMGLKNQGALVAGMKPRFSIFKISSVEEILYSWGKNFSLN